MTSDRAVSAVVYVSIPQVLMMFQCGCVNCSTLCKGNGVRLNICVCYSWEMELNVGLDVSFDKMWDWKRIRKKAEEFNSTKMYITNVENFC
jgi:hypothetical protein